MKTAILTGAALIAAACTALADPKDDVKAAAKKLAEAGNYTWRTTTDFGSGSPFTPGPVEGKTAKSGVTHVSFSVRDNTIESYVKGEKAVSKVDGAWRTAEELSAESGERGRGRGGFGRMLRNYRSPEAQAEALLADIESLEAADGVISGKLTTEGAKKLIAFGGGRRGGDGPQGPDVSNASGTVKFVIKDGVLAKVETQVKGSVSFNNNSREVERKTVTEISNVGSTNVTIPDEVAQKLGVSGEGEKKD